MLRNPKDHEATDYRYPYLFTTAMDNTSGDDQQYTKGLDIGRKANLVSISIYGSWTAQMKDGGSMTSYEKIGYHANTADLLRGFIDSAVPIKVYRDTTEGITETLL